MNSSLLLAIATLALVVGPLFERLARGQPRVAGLVDGLTVGGILVVSLLHLMPESTAHIGPWAPILLLVGLFVPQITEKSLAHRWQGWRITVGALILVLFVGHLLVEGAALASTASDERLALATVLVVAGHNLPLGVLLWGQTRRRFGRFWSTMVILAVAAITWFGPLLPISSSSFSAICSALLAGGLLHLVLQHEAEHEEDVVADSGANGGGGRARRHFWGTIGAVGAAWFLVQYLHVEEGHSDHAHGGVDLPREYFELFLETAPPLLFGVLGAGLIEAFLPDHTARWLSGGTSFTRALRGVLVGTPMPVCSCGVLPIYRALVLRGVPASAGLAFLVAAPEIGVDSVLLSVPLLGWQVTLARLAAAFLLALAIGWIVGSRIDAAGAPSAAGARVHGGPRAASSARAGHADPAHGHAGHGPDTHEQGAHEHGGHGAHGHGEEGHAEHEHAGRIEPGPEPRPAGWRRVGGGIFEAWSHLGPWILLGLFATVFFDHYFLESATRWAQSIAPWQQVVALSLLGMPSYICATAATPFAALLLAGGFSPGAVLAFLLTGPATNWTTFAALSRLHSRRVAVGFAATAFLVTLVLGLSVNALLPGGAAAVAEEHGHGAGVFSVACAALLCVLTLWVALRQGPRGFLAQLAPDSQPHRHG